MQKNKPETINIGNPRGGNFGIEFSDETELDLTTLAFIADNEHYLVKDARVRKLIFMLVKANIKNGTILIGPNFMRSSALTLIKTDRSLILKVGNIIASGASIIVLTGTWLSVFSYSLLVMIVYFLNTENCGYQRSDYFEQLPEEGPVKIYEKESTGHLLVAGNDKGKQIEMYVPSKAADEVTVSSNEEVRKTKTYTKVRKKAKQVNFSEFQRTDPILSNFDNLEEPEIPQRTCQLNDLSEVSRDVIEILK